MNDVSSVILDMDTVSYFTCLFDGFISSDFRIVVILILLDSDVYITSAAYFHTCHLWRDLFIFNVLD